MKFEKLPHMHVQTQVNHDLLNRYLIKLTIKSDDISFFFILIFNILETITNSYSPLIEACNLKKKNSTQVV